MCNNYQFNLLQHYTSLPKIFNSNKIVYVYSMYVGMNLCMYIHVCMYVFNLTTFYVLSTPLILLVSVSTKSYSTTTYIPTYVCMYVYNMCLRINLSIYLCLYVCMYVYLCTYVTLLPYYLTCLTYLSYL